MNVGIDEAEENAANADDSKGGAAGGDQANYNVGQDNPAPNGRPGGGKKFPEIKFDLVFH